MNWIAKLGIPATAGAATIAASLIMPFEGKENTAYFDVVGVPTICYGHTGSVSAQDVRGGLTLSDDQCMVLLEEDMEWAVEAVEKSTSQPIPDTMKGAFISFVYNVGPGNWRGSTLLKRLNEGKLEEACYQMMRWVYAGGKKLKGLENRREAETQVCLHDLENGNAKQDTPKSSPSPDSGT